MKDLKLKLESLLDEAEAPISNLKVACIIRTQEGEYYGKNHEWASPQYFAHAEERALFQMKQYGDFSGIRAVHIGGRGQVKKSQISPCDNCFYILTPFLSEDSKLVLFEPNNLSDSMTFTAREFTEAYSRLEYSAIKGEDFSRAREELMRKTPLVEPGLSFVADLRILGLEKQISFYLTGSASGRGGISQLINKKQNKPYTDLDIVAASDLDENVVIKLFEELANQYYPGLEKKLRKFNIYGTGHPISLYRYLDSKGVVKLELNVDKGKNTAFTRKDYLHKNWFHQLS